MTSPSDPWASQPPTWEQPPAAPAGWGPPGGAGPQAWAGGWGQPGWGPSAEERQTAMWAHLGVILVNAMACGALGWIVPVLLRRDNPSPFVRATAAHALNLALTQLLLVAGGSVVAFVLSIVLIGFLLFPVVIGLGIAYFVIQVIACIKANQGLLYRPPMVIPFVAA